MICMLEVVLDKGCLAIYVTVFDLWNISTFLHFLNAVGRRNLP
jgi:hypothetical protein